MLNKMYSIIVVCMKFAVSTNTPRQVSGRIFKPRHLRAGPGGVPPPRGGQDTQRIFQGIAFHLSGSLMASSEATFRGRTVNSAARRGIVVLLQYMPRETAEISAPTEKHARPPARAPRQEQASAKEL